MTTTIVSTSSTQSKIQIGGVDAATLTTSLVNLGMAGATTAGGSMSSGITIGTALLGIYFGSGVPTLSAPQGSLYLRTDGSSTSTRMYVNTNGTTGWTNLVTAT